MTAWLALSLTIEGELDQQELVDGVSGWVEVIRVCGNGGATYPCPLTTSSFASCRQMLLRVPR